MEHCEQTSRFVSNSRKHLQKQCLKPFIAVKISLVHVSLNGLRDAEGVVMILLQGMGGCQLLKIRKHLKCFFEPVAGDNWITLRLL
jgi:hypothetical protein